MKSWLVCMVEELVGLYGKELVGWYGKELVCMVMGLVSLVIGLVGLVMSFN